MADEYFQGRHRTYACPNCEHLNVIKRTIFSYIKLKNEKLAYIVSCKCQNCGYVHQFRINGSIFWDIGL